MGISCYSSSDLASWRSHGIVLPANESHPSHDLHPSKVVERPKVLYNARTGKYVMWMHVDDAQYKLASTGVAIASAPEGPFTVSQSKPCLSNKRGGPITARQGPEGVPEGGGAPRMLYPCARGGLTNWKRGGVTVVMGNLRPCGQGSLSLAMKEHGHVQLTCW